MSRRDHAIAPVEDTEKESFDLNPRQIAFALEFACGEYAGNATRSYMKVYGVSESVAGANGPRLLGSAGIREMLAKLHENAIAAATGTFIAWSELVPMAQAVIVATAQGKIRNRLAYEASTYLINRALGQPTAVQEVRVDEAQARRALDAYHARVRVAVEVTT